MAGLVLLLTIIGVLAVTGYYGYNYFFKQGKTKEGVVTEQKLNDTSAMSDIKNTNGNEFDMKTARGQISINKINVSGFGAPKIKDEILNQKDSACYAALISAIRGYVEVVVDLRDTVDRYEKRLSKSNKTASDDIWLKDNTAFYRRAKLYSFLFAGINRYNLDEQNNKTVLDMKYIFNKFALSSKTVIENDKVTDDIVEVSGWNRKIQLTDFMLDKEYNNDDFSKLSNSLRDSGFVWTSNMLENGSCKCDMTYNMSSQ